MNLNLKGRRAMVCGASQGLGLASAQELALLGAEVVLVARDIVKLSDALTTLNNDQGQSHQYLMADFSNIEALKMTIDNFLKENKPMDILVNNTGGPAGGDIFTATTTDFSKAFEMHVLCNQILTQALVPHMKAQNWGRIVNIISTTVKVPIAGLGVSNTIRAAVANWAKTLANELGPYGITVNNVLPGFHTTQRLDTVLNMRATNTGTTRAQVDQKSFAEIPLGRYGEPAEFGAAVAFICSPAASYITGTNLPVDGGRLGCL